MTSLAITEVSDMTTGSIENAKAKNPGNEAVIQEAGKGLVDQNPVNEVVIKEAGKELVAKESAVLEAGKGLVDKVSAIKEAGNELVAKPSRYEPVIQEAGKGLVVQRNYVLNDSTALKKKLRQENRKEPFSLGTEARDGSNMVVQMKTSFLSM